MKQVLGSFIPAKLDFNARDFLSSGLSFGLGLHAYGNGVSV